MARSCIDCGTGISKVSKGRCRPCALKVAYRSPEARARLSAMMREQRQDPWFNQALADAKRYGKDHW